MAHTLALTGTILTIGFAYPAEDMNDAPTHSRNLSPLVKRIGSQSADAWKLHRQAMEAKRRGGDVIVLSVGDPDFDTPQPVVHAAVNALRSGDTHYTAIVGREGLRSAVAKRQAKRTGLPITANNVVIVAGAQNGLFSTALCLIGPGDEVLVPAPMYVTYEATIGASGARMVPVPCHAARGFQPNPDDLSAAVTDNTRALFLANPNNPTGVVLGREDLLEIARIAERFDLWVVCDEVYADLVYDGEHISFAALPGMAERTVTVSSLSKSHAMPGWRAGWVIAPDRLVPHLERLALCMLYGLPGFIQAAAEQAVLRSDNDVTRMRNIFRRRRDLVVSSLEHITQIHCLVPQAGMFLLIDVRGTGLTGAEFADLLFESTGVAVLDAAPFGAGATEGFIRLSFSENESVLSEGCRRIGAFVESLDG